MDPSLLTDEENELRDQIMLVPTGDEHGTLRAVDLYPERAAELRRIIEEREAENDASYTVYMLSCAPTSEQST